jgi:hypothetical protein
MTSGDRTLPELTEPLTHRPPVQPLTDSLFETETGRRYLAEAQEAIRFVNLQPSLRLTRGGFITNPDTQHIQGPEFELKCVATALAWLDAGTTGYLGSPTATSALGSYRAKHLAENWGRDVGYYPYVANGDLIAAIIWRSIRYKRDGGRSPNCRIALKLLKHGTAGRYPQAGIRAGY